MVPVTQPELDFKHTDIIDRKAKFIDESKQISTTVSSRNLYKVTKGQKISTRATQVKRMGNIIMAAQEVVFDRKQRYSKQMRKVIMLQSPLETNGTRCCSPQWKQMGQDAAVTVQSTMETNWTRLSPTEPLKRGLRAITGELGNDTTTLKKSCREIPQILRNSERILITSCRKKCE
jgi:hypothetical protein